jgi:hypothetical protein
VRTRIGAVRRRTGALIADPIETNRIGVTLVFHGLLRQITADVAFGSKSDIAAGRRYVRLSLKSRHTLVQSRCPFSDRASLSDPLVGPLRSWWHEESQVESSKHQDNANIHYQPLPEAVSEEDKIYTHYNSCHRQHVKHYNHPSVHFSTTSLFHFLRSGPRPTQLRDAAAPPDEPTGKPVN